MNTFALTDEQATEINKWQKTHKCSLRTDEHGVKGEVYVGAISGATTYLFTPTGLGNCVEAQCACGEKINVTDYDLW